MSTSTITSTESHYKQKIGNLIRQNRIAKGLTQAQLASALGTSQSAIGRIEAGGQNLSMEMLARISDILNRDIISLNQSGALNFRIEGGHKLRGTIEVKSSKNAAMGLMAASLLNRGTTTLRHMPRIEEVNRMVEVLTSVGVAVRWLPNSSDLEIKPPARFTLGAIDAEAGRKTRSVIMLMGPLLHLAREFKLPYAGGCNLGERTVRPHLWALENFGLSVKTTQGYYHATSHPKQPGTIVMYEAGDTACENALMAAALTPGTTIIKGMSSNYMVRDVCYFLEKLGVKVEGIGTPVVTVHGLKTIRRDVEYFPSEDPIEAMTFLAIAATTNSPITVKRVPLDFIELELFRLREMGFKYSMSPSYKARNGHTDLVDIQCKTSPHLVALEGRISAQPYPGINIDNLPYFVPIAATAGGRTLIHDWVYENRAIYYTELNKLGANVQLIDIHRVYVDGPTRWKPGEVICPPALRPAVLVLIAMLAAPGTSVLRNVYSISRGYEDIVARLNKLGAKIEVFHDL
jgi:UDP-N-acetylglucosamine 1-carboxyvinyltransferase